MFESVNHVQTPARVPFSGKLMKALAGFKPAHNEKRVDILLAASLPTELSMLTINGVQNSQT